MVRAIKSRKKIKRASNKASSSSAAAAKKSGPAPAKVWQPGVDKIEEDEELHCDPSAYNSLHAFHVGWPCLSFDIIRDSLGLVRSEFPHTAYLVAGTQANQSPLNSVEIFKLSNISGKKRNLVPAKKNEDGSDMDDDSEDSDSDGEDESGSSTPILQLRRVAHQGCVNRIRSMPQSPHICATWSDTGYVQVWDFSSHLNFLTESEVDSTRTPTTVLNQAPLATFKHKDEGYAIDWSPCVSGRLVSGDCSNSIHLWEPTSGTKWDVDRKPFVGHSASVEDLQGQKDLKELHWHFQIPGMIVSTAGDGFNMLMPSNIDTPLPPANAA